MRMRARWAIYADVVVVSAPARLLLVGAASCKLAAGGAGAGGRLRAGGTAGSMRRSACRSQWPRASSVDGEEGKQWVDDWVGQWMDVLARPDLSPRSCYAGKKNGWQMTPRSLCTAPSPAASDKLPQ